MSDESRTLVIAEVGVNHNGSLDMALELVDAAVSTGADVVKFQTFDTAALVTKSAPRADYQQKVTNSDAPQFEMLRALELDPDAHEALQQRCTEGGVEFLSTAFEHGSLEFLLELGMRRLKSPSGEITNGPLLLHMARAGLPIIVSTGMAGLADIESALAVLAFGMTAPADAVPTAADLRGAFRSPRGQAALEQRITVLHCTSAYPAPLDEVNLRAMSTIEAAFGLPVGYSDHTLGTAVAVAAVARGATVIEKHLTLDRRLPGPDHAASLEPAEMTELVAHIRQVEQALGSTRKGPSRSETSTIEVARKSIVAARALTAGETFDRDALAVMRPGTGRSPMELWSLLGQAAARDYEPHEPI